MIWLPVMTMSDGTIIELPMPSSEDTRQVRAHVYRVRESAGVTEFPTLAAVLAHLANSGSARG